MEGLSPPLKCLIHVQSSLQNGESVRSALTRYLQINHGTGLFDQCLRRFLFAWEQGHDWRAQIKTAGGSHRRALLEILAAGLGGQSILAHLELLKEEIIDACDLEIKSHLEMLPLKMLAPLLIFQFPAFLLLLFGPLLKHLVQELNR